MSDLKKTSHVESLPSSPPQMGSHLSRSTLKLFSSNPFLNCLGKYVDSLLDLDVLSKYCAFESCYYVFPPFETDEMWTYVKPGRHTIPNFFLVRFSTPSASILHFKMCEDFEPFGFNCSGQIKSLSWFSC